jgi:hypothetical protein
VLLLTAEIRTAVHPADLDHIVVAEAQVRRDHKGKVKYICASTTTIKLADLPSTASQKLPQAHQDRRSLTKATNPLAQVSL